MPNGNWVPLPPFAQQFLTHLLMNKSISFLWKRIDGQNLKGESALMDVNWKLEYRKRMKRFIIVQTLSLAPAGMRKLGITICWTSFRFYYAGKYPKMVGITTFEWFCCFAAEIKSLAALLIVFTDEVTGPKGLQFCYINKFWLFSQLSFWQLSASSSSPFSNPLFTLKPFL